MRTARILFLLTALLFGMAAVSAVDVSDFLIGFGGNETASCTENWNATGTNLTANGAAACDTTTTMNPGGSAITLANSNTNYFSGTMSNMPGGAADRTLCVWFDPDTVTSYHHIANYGGDVVNGAFGWYSDSTSPTFYGRNNDQVFTSSTLSIGTFSQICTTYNGTHIVNYFDGAVKNTVAKTLNTNSAKLLRFGTDAAGGSGSLGDGTVDMVIGYGRVLNASEISYLYNSGNGCDKSCVEGSTPPPANATYVSLTAIDAYDGSSITTFNASLTNTSGTYDFTTTNGTINTGIDDTTGPYNITFSAVDYFSNSSADVDVSSGSVQFSLSQAFVTFSCFEKHTNTSLTCAQPGPSARQADNYTDQINVTGYHPVSKTYEVLAYESSPKFAYTEGWLNPEYLFDGDFATGSGINVSEVTPGFPSGEAYAYWNYTQLSDTNVDLRQGGTSTGSYSLSAACLSQSPIQLRAWANDPEIGSVATRTHCYNGTDWELVATALGSAQFFEHSFTNTMLPIEVYGFYDHELTVTAEDYLGASLSNFTLWVNSSLVNYTVTDNNTGTVVLGLLQGYNYTIQISENIPSGAERNNSIETAIFDVPADPSTSSESYQFNLTFPSLTITVLDEESGVNAPGNTTVTFTASNSSFSKTIVNGTGVFNASDSIPSGSYSVRFENDDYADRVYNLTYNREFPQSLTAYLVNTSSPNVVFVLEDRDTRNVVEGATITVQRFINGTLTTVNVLESDITGRTAFDYLSNEEYRFQITHPDYTAKNFTLNPILFPSYTLLMDSPSTAGETTGDYAGIGYVFNTARFVEGRAADLSATVSDASGGLVSYGFNITVNGALIDTQTGSNAYGSVLTSNVVIPETPYNGTAVIDYYYQLSDGNHYKFRFIYAVEQVNAYSNQTWVGNKDIAADIPILDRVVVVTIILAAVGALAFTFGGLTTAAIGMMLIMGFFSFTGFINPWIFAVPIIGLFFLLIGREAQ